MIHEKIEIGVYKQLIHFVICDNVEKEHEELAEMFDIELDHLDFCGWAEGFEQEHLIIINKARHDNVKEMLTTIVHESFHISNFILKRVGINPDVNNDEAQAYLLDYIFESIIDKIELK